MSPLSSPIAHRRPDFLLVGAPKCGTTAMTDFLSQHPEIAIFGKEVHFFGSDLGLASRWRCRTEQDYLGLFESARDGQRIGEASVFYLYSRCAAEEIKAFAPQARIIVMLRNPADMLYSLHSQLVYVGSEDITDFEAVLDAERDRERGERLPTRPMPLKNGCYRPVARYTEQLRRYFDVFGREHVHTVVFDDFRSDPIGSYGAVLRFLGVEPSFRPAVSVINANKRTRSTSLQKLIYHPPARMRRIAAGVVPTQRFRKSVALSLRKLNTKSEPRETLPELVRQRLNDEFAAEVEQLSELLGRDLTHWSRA